MKNSVIKNIGDFQENLGKSEANIGYIFNMIVIGFLVFLAIIMAIFSFTKDTREIDCSFEFKDKEPLCNSSEIKCNDDKKICKVTTNNYKALLISLFFILLAVGIFFYSKFIRNEANKSRSFAQLLAGQSEFNLVDNLVRNIS